MTGLSPALDGALSSDRPLIYGSVEINLPGYDLRVLDGSAVLVIGSKTFRGEDPVFGVLETISEITDGVGDEAPAITIGFLPANGVAAGTLANAAAQGSRVTVRLGAVDRTTGQVIDEYPIFIGEMDVPWITAGFREKRVELDCVSAFERFFDDDEGIRSSDAFHTSVWPGEKGFSNATGLEVPLTWGTGAGIA